MDLPFPILIWIALSGWVAFIFFMGGGGFGRGSTQKWIDRLRSSPRLFAFLDRRHGVLRAAFHYVEFATLTLLLYWAFGAGEWLWSERRALVVYAVGFVCAYADELHQSRIPGRQFRRIDFVHSLMGSTLALAALYGWLGTGP